MLVVHQLAGVLLDMDTLDPDRLVGRNPRLLIGCDRQRPFADKRMIKLRNLVTLRQVGIEIILAVEPRPCVDWRLDRHPRAPSLPDAPPGRHRPPPRPRGITHR